MKFYNERAKKVYGGLTFTISDFDVRDSKYLGPKMQVVAHSTDGNVYYMPTSFCRYVYNNGIVLNSLIGMQAHIIERETVNGRVGLYVEVD